jgi:hypothetical protein
VTAPRRRSAKLTGDGGEGRLGSHLAVEQLVRFLDHDDQLARFGFAVRAELVGLVFPGVADLAGQQIRDEQVIQVAFEFAEREHHMLSTFE